MKRVFGVLIVLILATACSLAAQLIQPGLPLTEKEVIDLLKSKQPLAEKVALLEQRGVGFELNPEIEKKLRKAKADDQFLQIVRNVGSSARAARAPGPGTKPTTPEEDRDFMAIRNELDPDRAIQMAEDFAAKHPDSSWLTYVYTSAAYAARQKAANAADATQRSNEIQRIIDYGEKSLKLKPDNILSLLITSRMLAQSQLNKSRDLAKEKNLAQAESYAKQAIELIDKLPRQPNQTDEQYQGVKAELVWEPHSALGTVHLERAGMGLQQGVLDPEELAKAEQEFQAAVSIAPSPAPQDYYRLGEVRAMLNKYDAAIEAFTKAGDLGQNTMIKTLADQRIEELNKRKSKTPPPAKQ
jgi:tetratricopeptide (TPR) repeat protein